MGDIDWGHLLFKFDGRINRGKYWLGVVVVWIVLQILPDIDGTTDSTVGWLLSGALHIGVLWAVLAINIKRWHDRGKSGWWMLIGLVPFIGWIWVLIETGLLPGTEGDNQYGPNPLAANGRQIVY